jgi:taurine dioxygenase
MRFTRRFGPLFVHVRSQFHSKEHPEVMLVSNAKEDGRNLGALGDGELGWHTDQAYTPEPAFATLLYGVEIPSQGGNTVFCDLSRAWQDLPEALRRRVAGRRIQYSIDTPGETQGIAATDAQRAQLPNTVAHPVARRHPYLDRVSLYISPDHMVAFEGLPPDDSKALMRELIDFAAQPARVYAHQWRIGDVVMWDNSQVMHRRGSFPPNEIRSLKRTGFYLPKDRAVPVAA